MYNFFNKEIPLCNFQLVGMNKEGCYKLEYYEGTDSIYYMTIKDLPINFVIKELNSRQTLPISKLYISISNYENSFDQLLDNLWLFNKLLQNHPYITNHIQELKLSTNGGIFDWSKIGKAVSKMIAQIKHTKITKLDLQRFSFFGKELEDLVPILSKTQITHLKVGEYLSEDILINLFKILPKTKIIHLYMKDIHIKQQETINTLLQVLPTTQVAHLRMGIIMFMCDTENCKFLLKQLIQILPQTNIIYLNLFHNRWNIKEEEENITQLQQQVDNLCKSNLQRRNEATDLWFKVFKNNRLANKKVALFPNELSTHILSFLYPKEINTLNSLSEHMDQLKIQNRTKTQDLLHTYNASNLEHALRIAAHKGDLENIELLLTAGININQKGQKTGKTALHFASSVWHQDTEESIKSLLIAGAMELPDNQNKLPRDYAACDEIKTIFLEHEQKQKSEPKLKKPKISH
jgi:hypothetical protein